MVVGFLLLHMAFSERLAICRCHLSIWWPVSTPGADVLQVCKKSDVTETGALS
jgi:hypothetical protein